MQSEDILVIGAGPAGLAVSACLRREGLEHVVLEREANIGSAWHRHYDRLHLHTTKTYSGLPMMRWPNATPRYPSREQVVQYLAGVRDRAPHCAPLGRYGKHGETQRGPLHGRDERRCDDTAHCRHGHGLQRVPKLPSVAGSTPSVARPFTPVRTRTPRPTRASAPLVVGCGNSGAEIALDLAEQGVDVAMVVRGPVHVVPRDLFGRPPSTPMCCCRTCRCAARRYRRGHHGHGGGGPVALGHRAATVGPNRMIEQSGRIPILDVGTIAMVKQGKSACCRRCRKSSRQGAFRKRCRASV